MITDDYRKRHNFSGVIYVAVNSTNSTDFTLYTQVAEETHLFAVSGINYYNELDRD